MTEPPRFAIVGHPNKGKSSIVATLAEDESVAISAEPGVTLRATAYPLELDGETLYELVDTPGFQRAREVLEWLDAHDRGAGARADVVGEFLRAHESDARFEAELELLAPVVDGAGILYVVDGSRPYGRQYEAEMEILRRTGRPRMALINLIGSGDHVEEWRAALAQYFSTVRVFDAVRADFSKRIELLRAFGAIDERWAERLDRAADALLAERERRRRRAAREIADLLLVAVTATESVELPEAATQAERRSAEEHASAELRARIRSSEREARRAVQQIYRHADTQMREVGDDVLDVDVFSRHSFRLFGLSTRQLAITGAASGAAAGGLVDAAAGGTSLMLGAGVGAAIGAAGVVGGARRIARARVLGRPLGGYALVAGPITDPNLPWVLLGRALLHLELVAERNHARREELVVEAASADTPARRIDAAGRRHIDGLLRRARQGRGDAGEIRDALADAAAALVRTP